MSSDETYNKSMKKIQITIVKHIPTKAIKHEDYKGKINKKKKVVEDTKDGGTC